MPSPFNFTLEERLSNIQEAIRHGDCLECKQAQVSRLEARAFHYNNRKRALEAQLDGTVVFHDAKEPEYYPFGSWFHVINKQNATEKHHVGINRTFEPLSVGDDLGECATTTDAEFNRLKAGAHLCKLHHTVSKRTHDEGNTSSEAQTDALSAFQEKLRESTKGKRRRVVTDKLHMDAYTSSILDVDLSTLKAQKGCLLKPKAVVPLLDPVIESNPKIDTPSTLPLMESPEKNVSKTETLDIQETTEQAKADESTQEVQREAPSFEKETVESVVTKAPSEAPVPIVQEPVSVPSEPPKAESSDIFGASTLQKLNFSMPVGNPLFAPKAIDASQFSIDRAPPMFVFGAQPSGQASQPLQFHTPAPPPPVQVTIAPPQVPQFNIPGFGDAQLAPQAATATNTFAATPFPKAKRGGLRSRGGRR
ncbi:hypothetical protein BaOVIS_014900 [Babesia ovis]|uniref:Uncharacterized protein n=1 Tax=Babesia ovis TaxID=5869 RepID=A0A9W5WUN1_BABOV|nr:hypothetical protein BaOVIS_014900 [Babesia ovis]